MRGKKSIIPRKNWVTPNWPRGQFGLGILKTQMGSFSLLSHDIALSLSIDDGQGKGGRWRLPLVTSMATAHSEGPKTSGPRPASHETAATVSWAAWSHKAARPSFAVWQQSVVLWGREGLDCPSQKPMKLIQGVLARYLSNNWPKHNESTVHGFNY